MTVPSSISAAALKRLRDMEGVIPYVYDDGDGTWPKRRISSFNTVGYPTIGVGHRIFDSEQERFRRNLAGGTDLSTSEIDALLEQDIETRAAATLRPKILVPITQSMWDALLTQAFNTGPNTNALKNAIYHINMSQWQEAADALSTAPKTSKGKVLDALVKRRAYEVSLFLQDGEPGVVEAMPTWVWVSGGSIAALLMLWGAIRLRRVWQSRTAAPVYVPPAKKVQAAARSPALRPGERRIHVAPPKGE